MTVTVNAYWSPLFGRTVIVPVYDPAASPEESAVTVTVAGADVLDAETVSHDTFDVAVKGIVLPAPDEVTWNDCCAGLVEDEAAPLKFSAVVETPRTALLVTTSVTGTELTEVAPEMLTSSVVL